MVDPCIIDGLMAAEGEAGVEWEGWREGGMISVSSLGLVAGSACVGTEVLGAWSAPHQLPCLPPVSFLTGNHFLEALLRLPVEFLFLSQLLF